MATLLGHAVAEEASKWAYGFTYIDCSQCHFTLDSSPLFPLYLPWEEEDFAISHGRKGRDALLCHLAGTLGSLPVGCCPIAGQAQSGGLQMRNENTLTSAWCLLNQTAVLLLKALFFFFFWFTQALDFETDKVHNLVINATNPEPLVSGVQYNASSRTRFKVFVTNMDEPPTFQQPVYTANVSEDIPVNTLVVKAEAYDPEGDTVR